MTILQKYRGAAMEVITEFRQYAQFVRSRCREADGRRGRRPEINNAVNAGIADISVNGRQGTWRPRATFGSVPGDHARCRRCRRY